MCWRILDIGWFQFVLEDRIPATGKTSTVKYFILLYTPLILSGNCILLVHMGCFPLLLVLVQCPPTWRINTYTKAIAHMLRLRHSIHVYMSVPPHFLSNCHAAFIPRYCPHTHAVLVRSKLWFISCDVLNMN